MRAIEIKGLPIPCRMKLDREMSIAEFTRFSESQELLWVERDSTGWIRIKHIHGMAVAAVTPPFFAWFWQYDKGNGLGKSFSRTGFVLPDTSILGCNIAWVLKSRLETRSKKELAGFPHLCPDLVLEFSSPHHRLADLKEKMECWISNGAQMALLINLENRSVTIYKPDAVPELIESAGVLEFGPPVAGLRFDMLEIWNCLDRTFGSR